LLRQFELVAFAMWLGSFARMGSTGVNLSFHDDTPQPDICIRRSWAGFSVDSVRIRGARSFDYAWQGNTNYLAVHDIALAGGEITIGGEVSANRKDLRDRLTFVPRDMPVSGWSHLAGPAHGYTALLFDSDMAEAEFERPLLGVGLRPLLYFEHAQLSQTLRRVDRLVSVEEEDDPLMAETLGLLAVLQLYPALGLTGEPAKGQLSLVQQKRIQDFVEAHLHTGIGLSELATTAGLSRFHFARSFSRTYGRSPHQYVLIRRIGLAASLLATSNISIAEIAKCVGFSSQARFSTAFRRMTGRTPSLFRQAVQ
jgi:AraC family transcriptional regulator